MLYEEQPLQCRNCGRRYPASQQALLDDHYDWHFRMNRVWPYQNVLINRTWQLPAPLSA